MSKSSPDTRSRILLTDTSEMIRKKISSAVTDSIREVYWEEERRGVCNLISILAGCESSTGGTTPEEDARGLEETKERCKGLDHASLKALVIEAVEQRLKGPRAEYARVRSETGYLEKVLKEGALVAQDVAEETLRTVKRGLGMLT